MRDREVLAAFANAGIVAVAVIFWGDPHLPVHHAGTVIIRDAGDAERPARAVETQPRRARGLTGIGTGLAAALERLAAMGCAHHSVINVSGDGKETILPRRRQAALRPDHVRDKAAARGVTINALVITGPDAFVMAIADFGDFAGALKRKLIREIAPTVVSQQAGIAP